MVEVAGIEPASFGTVTGLLRAHPAIDFLGPGSHAGVPADGLSRCLVNRRFPRPEPAAQLP